MRAALICRGCGDYAEIPGGCSCDDEDEEAAVEPTDWQEAASEAHRAGRAMTYMTPARQRALDARASELAFADDATWLRAA